MTEKDLFVIIKTVLTILWFNQQISQMPTDEEIMYFIKYHNKNDMEELYKKTIKMLKGYYG